MPPMVLLATGYAGLLLVVAAALERLARHTATRSERYRTAGFTYQPEHDLWMCPRDEPLWPHRVDREHRLVRYRARPSVCNACPVKTDCTPSHHGREITRPIDPWPHSEAGRFHRGVSVTLTALAVVLLLATLGIHHRPAETAVLVPATVAAGWFLRRWAADLRRTPSGFPQTITVRDRTAEPGRGGPSVSRYRSVRRAAGGTDPEE
ncbi:hypothetical protein ACTOB_005007 [Actinoplanes oblitus]|uniref:Transposase DDE domain-containing protein n=1 Tax=Actinoplanes oblitus TaxID=3040509 RepID=A0ABY8W7Q8_9ACTN|nr:hypothetical protein [Actinoplanes oblitus]WIM93042.1 hypothetical protein ACTOB_005007 [Actinoplanes oblitus]